MKSRLLIIIGIIVMITIPFVTFTALDRYSDYVKHLDDIAEKEANAPKPGEKYYIEPQRKAELEAVEIDLRNKITQLHQKNSLGSFAVNLDHLTKKIEVIVETEQFNTEIEEMISQYPNDIPIIFSSGKFGFIDEFESGPELNPITKSIITVQDRPINRTIVPITITEKTTNAQSLDTITQWNFSILGIEMSTLNDYWGNLADQYITTGFVDQNGNDVLDYSRIPDGMIFYKLSLWYYPVTCEDGQKIKGEGGYPEPIPIKKGASDVFFKSGDIGLYPDDDGKYFFDFVSGFETEIEFHLNVKVISQETKKCDLEIEKGNFTDMYYTNAVFSFED